MPKATVQTATSTGAKEQPLVLLLSDAVKQYHAKSLADAIVIVIPDTGKAQFVDSHEIKTGKSAGKMSKATFVIAELGSSFAGESIPYSQSNGDADGLPLNVKLSITATPPNRDGKTVDGALNRKVELKAVEPELKTGTDSK